jgi:putative heme-binding domain-containing protein
MRTSAIRRLIFAALAFHLLADVPRLPADNVQHGLRVPPGFEVTEFADSKLANDIYCMTLDPQGRVAVSGRGYIRLLIDDDNDGRADRAVEIAAGPKDGAMGLFWEGEWLYCTGDGGLRRYRIPKGTAKAAGPSELIRTLKTGGEHDAHAICRGPDGWLYVLCGNMTRVDKSYAQLPTSPIKDPVAGCVLRFTPDLKHSEIVADGFRNAYGMDFNLDGELFTFDSDNERCVSLPWYESIRFYHVIDGGHYGWQAPQRGEFWRQPPYFPDVVAPVATFGRGSPTGVACYRHVQFPPAYWGGIFLLDWTFGRIYFVTLERAGASYRCKKQVFLQSVGDNGFAPTAVVVHPKTGDLYVSIGGRGTRGAVYRIRYPKGMPAAESELARLKMPSRSLDWRPECEKKLLRGAKAADGLKRFHALAGMRRHRSHFLTAAVQEAIKANWVHPDRYIRKAAADLLATLSEADRGALAKQAEMPMQQLTCGFGQGGAVPPEDLARAARILARKANAESTRLEAIRLIQLALGDLMARRAKGTVWEGYSPRQSPLWPRANEDRLPPRGDRCPVRMDKASFTRALTALRQAFPSGHGDLDRETTRTLAVLEDEDPDSLTKTASRLTENSDPVEDVHYLVVLACLRGRRPAAVTKRTAQALLALDAKLLRGKRNRDRHWPLRIAEMHAELAQKDPALNAAILGEPAFGRPAHVLFARASGFDRKRAAAVFLVRAAKDQDYEWDAELVALLAELPRVEVLPVLRRQWDNAGLQEAILAVLARQPETHDRAKFLSGLNSPQPATVRRCLEALEKLPARSEPAEVLTLIQALGRLSDSKEDKLLAAHLVKYLGKVTGKAMLGTDKQAWSQWFIKTYPALGARLSNPDGVDVAGWSKRLSALDWSAGDAARGYKVFIKTGCASCHSGAQALGPDLRGVAGRFSRDDLFTAIIQPSKDVSPRYRTTQVTTADGKVYQGLIIYEAVDSLILQTGPATTIRVTNQQIVERRTTLMSLMPAGLIDKLNDRDIADLYASLRSLGKGEETKGKKAQKP